MAYNVFISSSQGDRGVAHDLAERLREAGADVSEVHQSAVPEDPVKTMSSRLRKADEVFVIVSDKSLNSPYVLFEMGAAWGQHKKVTPVVVGVEDPDLPPVVKQMNYVKYSNLGGYLSDLKKKLNLPIPRPKAATR